MYVEIENISFQIQKWIQVKNKRRGMKYLLLKMKQKEEGLKNYPKRLVW